MDPTSYPPPFMEVSAQGVLSVLAMLSLLVCLPPLVWHSRNGNLPASCLAGWFIVMNFFNFANPMIWPTDDIDSWWMGYGYCDIHAKLYVGAGVAISGPLVCIFRSLAKVLDTDRASLIPSKGEKRRNRVFEIGFCVVNPVISMVLHFVVQDHRYHIRAITGCWPAWYQSWVSIVVGHMWPPIILVIAAIYCLIVLYRLGKYKSEFSILMSNSQMSKSQFIRLLCLSLAMLIGSFPLQLYVLYVNAVAVLASPYMPYTWSLVHGPHWGEIGTIPSYGSVVFSVWIHVAGGFFLFAFFGFGRDATLMYRSALLRMGLGRVFPSLKHPHIFDQGPGHHGPRRDSTRLGSISSRAKLMFRNMSMSTESTRTGHTATTNPNMPLQALTIANSTRAGTSFSSGKPLPKVHAKDIPEYPHLEVWPSPSVEAAGIGTRTARQGFSISSEASTAISSPNPLHHSGHGGVRADSIVWTN